ncbi:MAG: multidrug efflux RND transporter permease subunit [Sphingomonadales bacterium]|nr:MAG: multidrug efflux RND transporter permease subunit [Sphingomonadales bacterium]
MHRFFAYNPVIAWVIALFILLGGLIGLRSLPIEQYPSVAPPSVTIGFSYAGADAQTINRNVTSIIEKQINGIDNFLYMSSTSRSNGTGSITVTFKSGTNLDTASTQVQDRLALIDPRLPAEVRQTGVTVTKSSSGFLMLVALTSKSGKTSALELGNFAANNVVDELRRVGGVGDVSLFGSQYAMRIWLDPQKMAGYGLSSAQVLAAVQEQNSQTAGGGLGEQPVTADAEFSAKIITQNRFSNVDQFRAIIVRSSESGATVTLGDVARVELGAENYGFGSSLNGKDIAGMAIQLSSGANALSTADGIRARLQQLQTTFPPDVEWSTPFDTTPFIDASISSVVVTLIEAMILVFLVMFVFLQNWRATIIPALVVPIALAGTCLALYLFGYSLNTLSLFGMVVAIGILVDDAIIVVENVERIMAEEGLNARRATVKAMKEVTGALVGVTLVLIAVFIPMAFFPGSTGGIYRQFSITLSVSIAFSALLALTLTPALCAALLHPPKHNEGEAEGEIEPRSGPRGWPRRAGNWFNRSFARTTTRYVSGVGSMLGKPARWLAAFLVICVLTGLLFTRVPGGFLPPEDQGVFFVSADTAPGATLQRTEAVMRQVNASLQEHPEVRNVVTIRGFNFFGQGQTAGMAFVALHPWADRSDPANSVDALITRVNGALSQMPEATAFAINPPPIPALGNAVGFSMKIESRSGGDLTELRASRDAILAEASKNPLLVGVRPEGVGDAPQLSVSIDRVQARALGLQIRDVNQALAIAFGSAYANDFSRQGNVLRVYLQAEASQRMTPEDVMNLRVPNASGEMVPFSAFTTAKWTSGPQQIDSYNGYPSLTISGQAAPGQSSGAALEAMEEIAGRVLTGGQAFEWTGTAFEEKQAGSQIALLLGLSLIVVFLLLAALYKSWAIPVSVLLVVPFGVLGAVVFTMLRGFSADVYFNVGLITIIGLAAKNAILIVEFAIEQEEHGEELFQAAKNAARLRLRPILMTSFAFILGMVPLVIASGAGAASRQAVGTGVMGGMLAATIFSIFFTPLFYVAARKWLSRKNNHRAEDEAEALAEEAAERRASQEETVPRA